MQKFWSISPKEHFEENNVVQKKSAFVVSNFWAKDAGTLPKNFWLRSLNCILKVQGIIFHHIPWCSMTHFVNFRPLVELFRRVYRNSFLWALRIVLKEKNLSNKEVFLYWSSELEQKHFRFPVKKSAGMPYFRSISPGEHFEENNVLKKNLFFLQTLSEKRLEVAPKSSSCVL